MVDNRSHASGPNPDPGFGPGSGSGSGSRFVARKIEYSTKHDGTMLYHRPSSDDVLRPVLPRTPQASDDVSAIIYGGAGNPSRRPDGGGAVKLHGTPALLTLHTSLVLVHIWPRDVTVLRNWNWSDAILPLSDEPASPRAAGSGRGHDVHRARVEHVLSALNSISRIRVYGGQYTDDDKDKNTSRGARPQARLRIYTVYCLRTVYAGPRLPSPSLSLSLTVGLGARSGPVQRLVYVYKASAPRPEVYPHAHRIAPEYRITVSRNPEVARRLDIVHRLSVNELRS
ncbi:hypothetical protein EVG20_g8138 [Dentipellis fragilis]|uniref:Uncharacterized protein n=1 Tax=Dentipellis fragilis TaxID=205917 RepID=A0A4Y9Y999_9AGAM|nr:hypothetical protein EVG20_g8138 [Dentipellis fragilis]